MQTVTASYRNSRIKIQENDKNTIAIVNAQYPWEFIMSFFAGLFILSLIILFGFGAREVMSLSLLSYLIVAALWYGVWKCLLPKVTLTFTEDGIEYKNKRYAYADFKGFGLRNSHTNISGSHIVKWDVIGLRYGADMIRLTGAQPFGRGEGVANSLNVIAQKYMS